MQFKNLQNITIAPMLMEMLLKDNIIELKKDRESNLPLYSVKTHKLIKDFMLII